MKGHKSLSTGLGKGLAGILGETRDVAPTPGVTELLGAQKVRHSPAVREMVTEMAISAVASAFETDGVVIVRRDVTGALATVASKIPASWSGLDPLLFEIAGQLWKVLESGSAGQHQTEIGGYSFLLTCQLSADSPMAAAVVRKRSFAEREVTTIGRLVRSVGAALGEPLVIPADSRISVQSELSDDGALVEVGVGPQSARRSESAIAAEENTALAMAGAQICGAEFDVQFVGQTEVEDALVTMVVLGDENGAPLFGLAVNDLGCQTGPVEAVFGAADVVGKAPFGSN